MSGTAMEDVEMGDASSSDSADDMEEEQPGADQEPVEEEDGRPTVYLPSQPLKEGEELVCDQSAYVMLHQAQTGAPCLSFDVIRDELGDGRSTFPLTMYLVSGTQASQTHANHLIVMKLTNLHRTSKSGGADDDDDDAESDSDEDDDDDEAKQPVMKNTMIKHLGCVNRVRTTRHSGRALAASWSELGRVNVWDLTQPLQAVDEAQHSRDRAAGATAAATPLFSFSGHQQEGFAVDWSPVSAGVLATGDCRRDIHVWKPAEAGGWLVDQRPLLGHTQSVEDLQWSPSEASVLASCSVDRSVRIWDTRAAPAKACMLTATDAHRNDVNVISWNRSEPFIASGGDDGFLHVWDLRHFQSGAPVATFKHHTEPVTTVEWHPTEATVLASGGADNQIALWDLSVEKDSDAPDDDDDVVKSIPPQLLFIHQGQTDIKELHWHPQLPGVIVSTAHSGFNIFRTISV